VSHGPSPRSRCERFLSRPPSFLLKFRVVSGVFEVQVFRPAEFFPTSRSSSRSRRPFFRGKQFFFPMDGDLQCLPPSFSFSSLCCTLYFFRTCFCSHLAAWATFLVTADPHTLSRAFSLRQAGNGFQPEAPWAIGNADVVRPPYKYIPHDVHPSPPHVLRFYIQFLCSHSQSPPPRSDWGDGPLPPGT